MARQLKQQLKDAFIPHEGNNHHPHAISHRMLVVYSVLLVLVKAAALVATVALPSSSLYSSSVTPQNIIALTNATRSNLNLGKLSDSAKLQQAAQAKADDMMKAQYFSHTAPSGLTPWDWFKKAGYQYLYAGENLAVHYDVAEDVQDGWMASPGHRANIVNPNYTEIGVGVSYGPFEGAQSHIVVELFGQPLPPLAAAQPVVQQKPEAAAKAKPGAITPVPTLENDAVGKVAAAAAAPKPAPAPTPAAEAPKAVLVPSPSVVDASLQLKQLARSYQVSVAVRDANTVSAQLAGQLIALQRVGDTNVWAGDVPYDAKVMSRGGEQLSIVAWGADGSTISQSLAWVAPYAQAPQVFNFQETTSREIKLLGFKVGNLNDSTKQFYMYFAIFLAVATLLNVLIKIRIQHPSIIGHAAGVLALAVLLFLV